MRVPFLTALLTRYSEENRYHSITNYGQDILVNEVNENFEKK